MKFFAYVPVLQLGRAYEVALNAGRTGEILIFPCRSLVVNCKILQVYPGHNPIPDLTLPLTLTLNPSFLGGSSSSGRVAPRHVLVPFSQSPGQPN